MKILDKISSPADLKQLNMAELKQLAGEIREFLIEHVTKTGGHLASNLGTVELTLALHRVFDSPKDKILFDVGHQSYTHKILTGRKDLFSTLRQYGGLSGFPKPEESEHDIFKTGHSSTSLSLAAGYARARRLLGEDYSVVAVIGDGALTGGMAFEALNDIGHSDEDKIIVVLNDNQMSIDENVGAMNSHFATLRSSRKYYNFKRKTEDFFMKIPGIGKPLVKVFKKIKRTVKSIFVKNLFFEELGFTYIGGIDGHNIGNLINALELAKNAPKNVVVHVMTQKGKGYAPAEKYPWAYHGIAGENSPEGGSNSTVFGEKLVDLAKKDEKIVAVTAAMKTATGLSKFEEAFPDRIFDVGIAEQHAVTMCAALAANGFRPVFAVYSTFLQRAYDQVIHDVCLQNLPVVFGVDRAGLVGGDGETHHGVFDIAYLRHMPNMTILEPATTQELGAMLEYALYRLSGPVCIRYPRERLESGKNVQVDEMDQSEICLPLSDVVVLSTGSYVKTAIQAAQSFPGKIGVVNLRILKPLDTGMLDRVFEASRTIVVLEDGVQAGGVGSAILEYAAQAGYRGRIHLKGIPDRFISHGDNRSLETELALDVQHIADELGRILHGQAAD